MNDLVNFRDYSQEVPEKLGRIDANRGPDGTTPYDWAIYVGEDKIERVIEADDITGYYIQVAVDDKGEPAYAYGQLARKCVLADVRFVYNGHDPRYTKFQ